MHGHVIIGNDKLIRECKYASAGMASTISVMAEGRSECVPSCAAAGSGGGIGVNIRSEVQGTEHGLDGTATEEQPFLGTASVQLVFQIPHERRLPWRSARFSCGGGRCPLNISLTFQAV